jgi:hypothetical protein
MRSGKRTLRSNAYADCLDYLSSDAEKRGLKRIASMLKEARRKLGEAGDDHAANDNDRPGA